MLRTKRIKISLTTVCSVYDDTYCASQRTIFLNLALLT